MSFEGECCGHQYRSWMAPVSIQPDNAPCDCDNESTGLFMPVMQRPQRNIRM